MNKSKMIMTVIVSFCLVILFIPMGIANANNKETASTSMGASLAGTILTTGITNISEDVASVTETSSETKDSTPDTSDRTPIYIVTTLAIVSFAIMATVCVKEYVL